LAAYSALSARCITGSRASPLPAAVTPKLAVTRADKALYAAKANGRNRVECGETPSTVVNPSVPQWVGRPQS